MKQMVWFVALACVAGVVYGLWRLRAKWEERNRASEERFAALMSQALPKGAADAPAAAIPAAAAPASTPIARKPATDTVVQQRLLLEAASKACLLYTSDAADE